MQIFTEHQQHTEPAPQILTADAIPSAAGEARWYAVHTNANHERRVAAQLTGKDIEHFLPQYASIRKWKDRKVRLELPLFPGYLFVHLEIRNRMRVLEVPGVARIVGFGGVATAVPEEDLQRVREILSKGLCVEPYPWLRGGLREGLPERLRAGRRVRVTSGPLAGMEGIVVRRKNRRRLVISFEMIERAMAVELGDGDVEAA